MKIVIVSDTHGDIASLEKVYLRKQNADVFLHAGDSEAPSNSIAPFAGVKGNCDAYFDEYPKFRLVNTPLGILRIEHHPFSSLTQLETLKRDDVKIFVHGHTHKKEATEIDGIYVFCPGSLSYPRDSEIGSYLVLDIENNSLNYTFKNI